MSPTDIKESAKRPAPRSRTFAQLPADLQAYAQGYLELCRNIIDASPESRKSHPTLWVTAYCFGPDLLQSFLFAKEPEKKLELAEQLLQSCKVLTYSDNPLEQQLGHIGEKLALGMKCFIGPNIDMVSQRSLQFIFNDTSLEKMCVDILNAYQKSAATEQEQGEGHFCHRDIIGAFQSILHSVREKDFQRAQQQAEQSMNMCAAYMDKYDVALKGHEFFGIINFLLDSRVKGRLFGAEDPNKGGVVR